MPSPVGSTIWFISGNKHGVIDANMNGIVGVFSEMSTLI